MANREVKQFNFNDDYPDHSCPPQDPVKFPYPDIESCARITTRMLHNGSIQMVHNVLVKTGRPSQNISITNSVTNVDHSKLFDDDCATSFLSDSSSSVNDEVMDAVSYHNTKESSESERAYLLDRNLREAIYGRVCVAIVLRRPSSVPSDDVHGPNVEWEATNERCAIKEMDWQRIRAKNCQFAEDPIQELATLQYLRDYFLQSRGTYAMGDVNIVLPIDILSDETYLYSVMPFCDGNELFDVLADRDKFTESECRYWMKQILAGLDNLQRAGVCHRDMSLENLLTDTVGRAYIIDMGMSIRVPHILNEKESRSKIHGNTDELSVGIMSGDNREVPLFVNATTTPIDHRCVSRTLIKPQLPCGKWNYMSPEIVSSKDPYDGFAVDVWAVGVMMFIMVNGYPPWNRACMTDERFKYLSDGYTTDILIGWNTGLSANCMDLLERMFLRDPKDRLSLDQVRAHPWMNGPILLPPGVTHVPWK